MSKVKVGDNAKDFLLKNHNDQEVSLKDLSGKKVLLSFHPLAWTKVCAEQMRSLEANHDKFTELNTVPLGISVDPGPCKKAWASELDIKKTSLLCDFWPHGKVASDFGIFIEDKGISERANIIIDEKGKVVFIKIYPISELPDITKIIDEIGKY
ncbi:MAG: redoxin domain-containing protein [Bacillota bacterium]